MKSLLILMRVELLKVKRSLALVMLLACPAMVVLLNTGMQLKRSPHWQQVGPDHWQNFWAGNLALWAYFMLPLFIALITALLNQQEHKYAGWRLMLCLPLTPGSLFFCKALLAFGFVCLGNACLWLFCAGVQFLLSEPGSAGNTFAWGALALSKICIACLPVLVIQHAVSWLCANMVAPLAVGVCATMAVLQLGSSEYWVYFPWAYSLMASNGSAPAMQQQALLLAIASAVALYAMASTLLARRHG